MHPLKLLARLVLRLGGWTPVGEAPDVPKAVIIAAPHTSNWDAVWALAYKVAVGLDIRFYAKHTLFWFPLGALLKGFGGIPLDRAVPGAAVNTAVRGFRDNDSFYFGLAPEGTRRWQPHWKSGFYRIAEQAGVPVILGFMDFGRKRVGIGPTIELSGDRAADLEKIAAFYADIQGCRPENAGPVRFADEPEAGA